MFGPFPLPAVFFFSAWLLMIFWGMVAPDLGVPTISYVRSMLVTIGLWLVVLPLAAVGRPRMSIVGGRRSRAYAHAGSSGGVAWSLNGEPQFDVNASFSGVARRFTSKAFRGGRARAFFGGVQIDLRDAVVEEPPAVVTVRALFGGVELLVPSDWNVEFDVSATLGGVTDERRRAPLASERPQLVINGSVTAGGVTVKD